MSQVTIGRHPALTYQPIRAAVAAFRRLREEVAYWRAQQRARAQLLLLDERGLKDIGISRAQAQFEAEKPFWRG
jgi:uncharacterized protein YjiS (DUF1127 family)